MAIAQSERAPAIASRVKGPRKVLTTIARVQEADRVHAERALKHLQRLAILTARALAIRAKTDEERTWCRDAADTFALLIGRASSDCTVGEWIALVHAQLLRLEGIGRAVLSGGEDPSDRRRVRKRARHGSDGTASADALRGPAGTDRPVVVGLFDLPYVPGDGDDVAG